MNRRTERGNASIELVLMTPVLLVALGFLVVAGRMANIRGDLSAASRDAARAASLASSYDQAAADATATATASLAGLGVTCADLTVQLGDPSTFVAGGTVEATITCAVSLADVAVPGLPGHRLVSSTAVEVIDAYRGGGA